jgi:hypothetical protein
MKRKKEDMKGEERKIEFSNMKGKERNEGENVDEK